MRYQDVHAGDELEVSLRGWGYHGWYPCVIVSSLADYASIRFRVDGSSLPNWELHAYSARMFRVGKLSARKAVQNMLLKGAKFDLAKIT